jgi:hypothetical protein
VVARQLAVQVLEESRLLGRETRARESKDQVCDVVGAVLRDREQQKGEVAAGGVVQSPQEAEVDEREGPSVVSRTLPWCGSAW